MAVCISVEKPLYLSDVAQENGVVLYLRLREGRKDGASRGGYCFRFGIPRDTADDSTHAYLPLTMFPLRLRECRDDGVARRQV